MISVTCCLTSLSCSACPRPLGLTTSDQERGQISGQASAARKNRCGPGTRSKRERALTIVS
jgi:hypothetical protein